MPPTDAEGRGAGRRETGGARAWSRSRRPLQPAFAEGGRRARLRDLGGQAEVGENLPDDGRVLDGRDELHSATAPRAGEDVDLECPAHQIGRRPVPSVLAYVAGASRLAAEGSSCSGSGLP